MVDSAANLIKVALHSTDIMLSAELHRLLYPTALSPFQLIVDGNMPALKLHMDKSDLKAVLLDLDLEDENALPGLVRLCEEYPNVPVIVLGDVDDETLEAKIVALGAQDYLPKKQLSIIALRTRIRHAIARHRLRLDLHEERASFDRMIESIKTGKISSITIPSGKIRLLDERLMEENEALLEKIEAKNAQLQELAHYDPLTGLPNRRQFEEYMSVELARAKRHKRLLVLFFIDLDKFKTVNDTFGHPLGDALLVEVAKRLKQNLRLTDYIARIAGDEFAILLPEIRHAYEAGTVAQKVLKTISEMYHISGKEIHLSASIGIACYPRAGEETDLLTKHADVAMYNAKQAGRNTYRYFSTDLENIYSKRIKIENELRFAQDRQQLYLVYQPQIDLDTNEMVAMETLLRWKHPELGLISPAEFIPIAEETGLITSIGEWVLKESFEQYAKWLAMGYDPKKLAINISPIQLLQKNLSRMLQSHMVRHAIEPRMIEIEITETTVMTYSQEAQVVLEQLHQLGVSLAIDDFGTGYSSLSHLRQLPLSVLKIDRSFVKDIPSDPSAATIVKTVIALAKNLGFGVVAEGVETKAQLNFLNEHGCLYAQGYYFSQPMDAEKMTLFLEHSKQR